MFHTKVEIMGYYISLILGLKVYIAPIRKMACISGNGMRLKQVIMGKGISPVSMEIKCGQDKHYRILPSNKMIKT